MNTVDESSIIIAVLRTGDVKCCFFQALVALEHLAFGVNETKPDTISFRKPSYA